MKSLPNNARRLLVLLCLLVFTWPLLAQSEKSDSDNIVATYPVQLSDVGGNPTPDQAKIWSAVKALVPSVLLNLVDQLEFFQIPADLKNEEISTDAYASLNENHETFTLGLNLDSAKSAFVDHDPDNLPEFQKTIFHEFGHVLSFQPSQIDDTDTVTGTLVIDEGTLKPGAYLNLFYNRFWKTAFPKHGPATTSDADGTAFYNKSPDSFVTEYAATGPVEDFAETFAYFVANSLPKGKTVKDEKLRFFAGFGELVTLREQMRKDVKRRHRAAAFKASYSTSSEITKTTPATMPAQTELVELILNSIPEHATTEKPCERTADSCSLLI